jgi:hypothetical protein
MTDLGWAEALIVFGLAALAALWAFGEIVARFSTDDEWDDVAERKRRIERQAKIQSGEYR